MSRPVIVLAVLAAFLLPDSLSAQRSGTGRQPFQTPITHDATIKVSYENGGPAEMVTVTLSAVSGVIIGSARTDAMGEVSFKNVAQGIYRAQVSGSGIQQTTVQFVIEFAERVHREFVTARHVLQGQAPPNQGIREATISAEDLAAPVKAREEFAKGYEALSAKNFPEAIKHLQKATEIYPKYASAFRSLGVAQAETGAPDKARASLEKAISLNQHYVQAYLDLSRVLYSEKKYEEVEAVLSKALVADPMNPETLTLLSRTQVITNRLDEAIANARKVHTIPDHKAYAMAHFICAKALEVKGLPDQAAAEYRIFLEESPDSPNAERARAALAQLQKQNP